MSGVSSPSIDFSEARGDLAGARLIGPVRNSTIFEPDPPIRGRNSVDRVVERRFGAFTS